MLDAHALQAQDLQGLSHDAAVELATALLAQLAVKDELLDRREREIKFKDAKIERITFELARLKAWKFGARTEAMNAEQRQLFEDTMAEDEADLQARLKALQGDADQADTPEPAAKRKPRREQLPEHLPPASKYLSTQSTDVPCLAKVEMSPGPRS